MFFHYLQNYPLKEEEKEGRVSVIAKRATEATAAFKQARYRLNAATWGLKGRGQNLKTMSWHDEIGARKEPKTGLERDRGLLWGCWGFGVVFSVGGGRQKTCKRGTKP